MKKTAWKVLAVAVVLSPVAVWVVRAQSKPTTATVISKEEIEAVSKAEQDKPTQDMNIKIVSLGYENYAIGVIHRGTTRVKSANASGGGARGNQPPSEPCGSQMNGSAPGGVPGGMTHDYQTEGYYIISGGGTMILDGHLGKGRHFPFEPNGPSCGGTAYDAKKVEVKAGDVVIVPPNVVHGWADVPDHVDYLSFRPSEKESTLQAGWVNPIIQSMKP